MAMMLFILSAPWRASSDAKGSEKPAEFMAAILACAAPMGITPAARHPSRRRHEARPVRRFPVARRNHRWVLAPSMTLRATNGRQSAGLRNRRSLARTGRTVEWWKGSHTASLEVMGAEDSLVKTWRNLQRTSEIA